MATDANIGINLGGDATDLIKALKLAKNSVGDFQKKTREAINTVGKIGVTAAAAGAAIAGALFKATVDTADEIERLSRIAGVSVEVFQDMAAGAKVFGVEQDKLSDILKDTNDKVGDFLTTGGGAMADYFETIAPKIGQTAEEFRNLSGKEALQKYVNGLEEANVSQAEMTFFMEAIASDATMLLPLLKNNGKEFDRIAASVDKFGGALTGVEIDQLQKVKQSMTETSIVVKNLINKVMAKFAPIITAISEKFNEAGDGAIEFGTLATGTFDAVGKAAGFAGNAIRGIAVIFKGIMVAAQGFRGAIMTVLSAVSDANQFLMKQILDGVNQTIDNLNNLPGVDLERMVLGENNTNKLLTKWKDDAIDAIRLAKKEMHELAMDELPSDSIKNWMDEVVESANKASEAILAGRKSVTVSTPEEVEARASLLSADTDSYNKRLELMRTFGEEMKAEEEKQAVDAKNIQDQKRRDSIQIASQMFSNISSLMSTESKKLFEIGKVAAISGAVVDGIAAAVSSYKFGASIGGPLVGDAFAASSLVATGAMISNLKSASFSGGGSAGGGGGGGAVSQPQQQEQQTINRTVTFEGLQDLDANAFTSGGTLEALMGLFRDAQRNGEEVFIA